LVIHMILSTFRRGEPLRRETSVYKTAEVPQPKLPAI
jgi:hypothetical protein